MHKIDATFIELYNTSKRCTNRHYGVVATRTSDGAQAKGFFAGHSGTLTLVAAKMFTNPGFQIIMSQLSDRKFRNRTDGWPYLGHLPEEISSAILHQWNKATSQEGPCCNLPTTPLS